ncbi:hypothetical protein CcaverHIS641_0305590 [Cutaneotrichosporon cavernicola]|nr:hypothetical protein CcaverHIS641_0305590 [Cutaneotrichosporon cavernicola]
MKLLYFAALFVAASAKMLPTYPEDITASASQTQDVEVQGPPIWVSTKGATTINGSVMPVEATPSPGEGGSSSVASGSAVPASRSGESSAVSAVTTAAVVAHLL